MFVTARYLCTDMRNRKYFSVTKRCGFLWLKEKRVHAYWDNGWFWESGERIAKPDVRIALCEAAIKVGFQLECEGHND